MEEPLDRRWCLGRYIHDYIHPLLLLYGEYLLTPFAQMLNINCPLSHSSGYYVRFAYATRRRCHLYRLHLRRLDPDRSSYYGVGSSRSSSPSALSS